MSMNTNSSKNIFVVRIYKNGQSLPLSIESLKTVPIGALMSSQQKVTFRISRPGEYLLQVGDTATNIMGSPFLFSYFTGNHCIPCKGEQTWKEKCLIMGALCEVLYQESSFFS